MTDVPAQPSKILLSPPHLGTWEAKFVADAFASNWIAPLGPQVDAFEREFCAHIGAHHAVALSSGTAALHLALQLASVGAGDEVLVSTLTFCASVNPVRYLGARPVFIDSERASWNMDPVLLTDALEERARRGRLPRAVVLVHLYGQTADIDPIATSCAHHGVALIEDAAEALGATYKDRSPGVFGRAGVFSFNGNKIITTSGGGMLVSDDSELVAQARKLATQARDPAPHYEHSEVGYNYRLSNILAAVGRGQLKVLDERVRARRWNFEFYRDALGSLPGIEFMPEAPWGAHTRWLTTLTLDSQEFGATPDQVRLELKQRGIEARPVWKPMHRQPVFEGFEVVGGAVADDIFARGLCLPSGSSLSATDLERVATAVREVHHAAMAARA
jgi:pyridoxal phosphate-dependent aminotransferase EpsN